ncbi:hypothetical protein HA402_001152 [Bradysia odoriphaga]|nr:hypothetical protein HA402_001152 [Bradysia odoriphaga]
MNGKKSSKRILNNGLPQGAVLSCFLYCLYTSDIPNMRSRLFMYADDTAIAFQAKTFEDIEKALRADLVRLSRYFASRFKDLQPTELEWLSVLSNIPPANILRHESAIRECEKIRVDEELPIHGDLALAPSNG